MTNLHDPDWVERSDEPLRGRAARIGAPAGATKLGATLYEIDPGQVGSPFHLHHANEELILVLAGRPTLRTFEGERVLDEGDVVACPVGRAGAHQVRNDTDEAVRVLVVSTMVYPDVAELPDSAKVLVASAPPGSDDRLFAAFPRSAEVDRLAGETR